MIRKSLGIFITCFFYQEVAVVVDSFAPVSFSSVNKKRTPDPTRRKTSWSHNNYRSSTAKQPRSSLSTNRAIPTSTSSSSALSLLPAALAGGIEFSTYSTVAVASVSATAKLLSSIGLGSLAARQPNVLDKTAISALSRLTYWIFQPAFLLCSVASTLGKSADSGGIPRGLLALMPVGALLQIGLGSIVSSVVNKVLKIPDEEASDVRMCTTFANSGPLPLLFADTLFQAIGGLQTDVTACISFYLLAWSPLFWSFGRVILGTYDKNSTDQNDSALSKFAAQVRNFLSPPVVGCLLGILIASVPFLKTSLMGGFASPLYGACKTLGTAYLPAALLILAGSLVNSTKSPSSITTSDSNKKPSSIGGGVSSKSLMSILACRFCLAPLLAIGMVKIFNFYKLLGEGRSRAVLMFVLLMEGCMPPAQNSVIMLQLEGLQERAGKMAKTLALLYSISVVPITLLLSACLAMSGILSFS